MAVEGTTDTPADALAYSGRLIAFVSIVAPRGGLPRENLDPLLRVRQDGIFHPLDLRQDVATLYRAGQFAQVEAWIDPWPAELPNGDQIDGVRVEYRVYPTPRVAKLTVTGAKAIGPKELLGRIGLAQGDAWDRDDPSRWEAAVATAYRERGYPAVKATLTRSFDDDGDAQLTLVVDEGAPQRMAELKVRPNDALTSPQVQAILARNGLVVGRPWTDAALRAAQDAVVKRLHAWPPGFLGSRPKWWPEARVNLKVSALPDGGDRISVLIEPRRPWTIDYAAGADRRALPTGAELVEAMGLDEGARLGRDFGTEAGVTLTDDVGRQGYLDAAITVTVAESDAGVTLTVGGTRGPRYLLRTARSIGEAVDPDTIGASFRVGGYGCVDAPHPIGEGGRKKMLERTHADRFLCQATAESAREVLTPALLGRQPITPETTDRAADAIEEFFRSQGFLGVAVTRKAFDPGPPKGNKRFVEITYDVHSGPRSILEAVNIEGAERDVAATELYADLLGEPLNPNTVAERTRRLVEAHQDLGYLHADAHVDTQLAADGTATVRVEVAPGPLVLVGSVLIRGHSRTRRETIERPITVHPGDPVSPGQLATLRRSLYDLGVFSRVSVDAVGDEDRVKDVVVSVTEKKNLAFEVGGGIATDNGAAVFARAGHRNLFGLAHRLTLYGQAGVGWVGDGWNLDVVAPEWKAAARYEAADIPALGERVSVDLLFNEQQQERAFRIQRSGGGIGVRLKLGERLSAELGYRAQLRTLLDIDPGVLLAGDAWADELGVTDPTDPSPILPSKGRWASGIDADFALDLRDDVTNPTKGGIGSLGLKVNDDLLSDIAFLSANGSWTQLVPVGRLGLVLRARGGAAIVPDGTSVLPIEDRFRAGGGGSFRGFDVDQIGPANYVSVEPVDWPDALEPIVSHGQRGAGGRWVPTGGDAMAIGSAEVDVPFPVFGLASMTAWQLAVFSDFGNIWWLSPAVTTDSSVQGTDPILRGSVGVGIRRSTPIGPLQLDLGINPAPLAYRNEQVFRVHFAVGAL